MFSLGTSIFFLLSPNHVLTEGFLGFTPSLFQVPKTFYDKDRKGNEKTKTEPIVNQFYVSSLWNGQGYALVKCVHHQEDSKRQSDSHVLLRTRKEQGYFTDCKQGNCWGVSIHNVVDNSPLEIEINFDGCRVINAYER